MGSSAVTFLMEDRAVRTAFTAASGRCAIEGFAQSAKIYHARSNGIKNFLCPKETGRRALGRNYRWIIPFPILGKDAI
jgi:hypothetical protein